MNPTAKRLLESKVFKRAKITQPILRDSPKIGRNQKCYCGSGLKYKKCCLRLEQEITSLETDIKHETIEEKDNGS